MAPLTILQIYGSRYAHPIFKLSNATLLLAKLLLKSESLENPLLTSLWNVNFTLCTRNCMVSPLANTSSTKTYWHAIFQERKCIQHAITIISHSWFLFCLAFLLIQHSGFTYALIHAIFTSQFSHIQLTLSPYRRRPCISTVFSNFLILSVVFTF